MAVDAGRSRAALFDDLGWRRPNPAAIGGVLALAALLPVLWQNDYVIDVALTALIWMILNQSWNLQLGFGGIWNFGQLAIFAIGAYASALVALHWGVPAWMAMIMGGLGASLASLVIAIPALRLRGIYASLLTFSFGEVVRLLVISDESGVTGGTFGLAGVPDLAFGGLSPDARQRAYYWLALAIVTLVAVFIYVFVHSPLGTALRALRDSPGYAASRGISPLRMQVITFCASAFIAGIAGAFYAHYFGVISPSVMGLGPMALFVAMLVVGGLGTLSGPLLGTALVMLVSEYLRDYQESRLIIVGVILLVTMVVAPRGLVPALGGGWARIQRWMAEDEGTDADHPHRSSAQTASESSPAPAGTEREDP